MVAGSHPVGGSEPAAPSASRTNLLRLEAVLAIAAIGIWILVTGLFAQVGYDAITYLAAGERLNADHLLYALQAGDRYVAPNPPYWTAPLLYPPLIGVVWRPLAAMPGLTGFWLWMAADVLAMLWAVWYVIRGLRWSSIALIAACSIGVGLQLTIGNVAGFFVAGMIICWVYRDRPWIGAIVGLMVVLKITPFVLVLWLLGQRRWGALAWCGGAIAAGLAIGVAGAGLQAHFTYLDVMASALPQPWSVSGMTHIGQATTIVQIVGCALILLTRRNPALSYRVAVLTMFLGSPAIGIQSPAILVALGAPGSEHRRAAEAGAPATAAAVRPGLPA